MRSTRGRVAGFVLALGLAYGIGRGVQWMQTPPGTCPDVSLARRLHGHIVGLAHVDNDGTTPLHASHGGNKPWQPRQRSYELTVVDGDRLSRTHASLRASKLPNRFTLRIPVPPSTPDGTAVFFTSACVPDHPVALRVWQANPASEPRDLNAAQEDALRDYLRRQLPGEHAAIASTRPRLLGELAANLPGCTRPAVLRFAPDKQPWYVALVCLDAAGAVERTLVAPAQNLRVRELAALDIDGDGHDELLTTLEERGDERTALLYHDAGTGEFAVIAAGEG